MKKIIFSLLLLPGITIALNAQKTIHDPNAEVRPVTTFHAIKVSSGIDLYLSQGNQESLAISSANKVENDKIKTVVENGVLKIWFENDRKVKVNWGNKKMKVYVSVKTINAIQGNGGSDITIEGILKVPDLKLEISGGSDFIGKVDVSMLFADASGGSDIKISGNASSLKIDASGGSDVFIMVNKELNAQASGGSDIKYKGHAVITNIKTSGANIKKTGI